MVTEEESIFIHAPPSQITVIRAEHTSGQNVGERSFSELPLIQVWDYIARLFMSLQMCAPAISLRLVRNLSREGESKKREKGNCSSQGYSPVNQCENLKNEINEDGKQISCEETG